MIGDFMSTLQDTLTDVPLGVPTVEAGVPPSHL